MTDGVLACSEELWLTNSSSTLTQLVGLISTSLPTLTVEDVDVTTQDDDCVTRMRAGRVDPGTLDFTIRHVPNSATDQLLIEHLTSRETRAGKIVVSDGSTGTIDVTVSVYVSSYNQGDGTEPGGSRTSSGTLRLTALPTQAATP